MEVVPFDTPRTPSHSPRPQRSVALVHDHRTAPATLVETAACLDPLDARGVSTLRIAITTAHRRGETLFTCATCGGAVGLVVQRMDEAETGGTRGYFRHRTRSTPPCPQASGEMRHPDEVEARRFDGAQEGRRHARLKALLAERLAQEPGVTDVAVERPLLHAGGWRQPDVQAVIGGRRTAFEVQIARPLLRTIVGRAAFYAAAGVDLVWVLDARFLRETLGRQAFHDIAWSQSGHVTAFDERFVAQRGPMQLRLVSLQIEAGRLRIGARDLPLARAIAVVAPRDPAALPPLARDPHGRAIFTALRIGDARGVSEAIAELCRSLGLAGSARDAERDRLPEALAALGTLLTGHPCGRSVYRYEDPSARLDAFLCNPKRAPWACLLDLAADVSLTAREALAQASPMARAAADLPEHRAAGEERLARWTPLLVHLFPRMRRALATRSAPGT